MKTQIKIPAVGESINEATISQWVKKNGESVKRDDVLLILETDKASVEVVAESDGVLATKAKEGETVAIGAIVGEIDSDVAAGASAKPTAKPSTPPPVTEVKSASAKPTSTPPPTKATPPPPPTTAPLSAAAFTTRDISASGPAVRRIVEEQGLQISGVSGTGKDGRLTKGDLLGLKQSPAPTSAPVPVSAPAPAVARPTPLPQARAVDAEQTSTREPMSKLRQTIAKRLVEAQHNAAILTTFNEIDMSAVMALRAKYKDKFKERYGINLGFMGFFVKAAIEALKAFPRVNGLIDGTDIVFNHFYNIGIAVGTEKGLLVPVVRDADRLSIADVELSIKHYAEKARAGKISLEDLSAGTFTISNGGVYGSLLSTPILNPPQSAILGLHKIEERPVAVQGKIEIRPMMYVALSYDHRIIDGAESVSFLVKIKDGIEDPARLLIEI